MPSLRNEALCYGLVVTTRLLEIVEGTKWGTWVPSVFRIIIFAKQNLNLHEKQKNWLLYGFNLIFQPIKTAYNI